MGGLRLMGAEDARDGDEGCLGRTGRKTTENNVQQIGERGTSADGMYNTRKRPRVNGGASAAGRAAAHAPRGSALAVGTHSSRERGAQATAHGRGRRPARACLNIPLIRTAQQRCRHEPGRHTARKRLQRVGWGQGAGVVGRQAGGRVGRHKRTRRKGAVQRRQQDERQQTKLHEL